MSIKVELSNLADVIALYRFAYLMTVGATDAPHAVAISPVLQGGMLIVRDVGSRTRENAIGRPVVGLVWPPLSDTDYSLIVDGQAEVFEEGLRITPLRAVLHRPAPPPGESAAAVAASGCGADCVRIDLGA